MRTTVAVSVHRTNISPVFGEGVTTVRIDDEGGGAFVVLEQADDSERSNGKLSFDIEELREVLAAAESLLDQAGLSDSEAG